MPRLRFGLVRQSEANRLRAPQETGPTEEGLSFLSHRIEVKFSEPNDGERSAEFIPDFLLGHYGRARILTLAGIACQHQAGGAWPGDRFESLQVAVHINPADDMIAAAIEKERKGPAQVARLQKIVPDEADGRIGSGGPGSGGLYGQIAQIYPGHVETLLGQPYSVRASAAPQVDGPARSEIFLRHHATEFTGWLTSLPGRIAGSIALFPAIELEFGFLLRIHRESPLAGVSGER